MKGGYKIIDFKNVSLSGTPVTMTDVLVDLLNNYGKVVLLSNVVLSGSVKDDCFSTVLSDGAGGVKLNCYDGYISINSSGAVTYTVASASGMAGDIANLQSGLSDTDNMIAPEWSNSEPYQIHTIVQKDKHLYKALKYVPAGTSVTNTEYWMETDLASNSIAYERYGVFKYMKAFSASSSKIRITCSRAYQFFFIIGQKGVIVSVTEMNGNSPAQSKLPSSIVTVSAVEPLIFDVEVEGSNTAFTICSDASFTVIEKTA